jgi:hypothetical protein
MAQRLKNHRDSPRPLSLLMRIVSSRPKNILRVGKSLEGFTEICHTDGHSMEQDMPRVKLPVSLLVTSWAVPAFPGNGI